MRQLKPEHYHQLSEKLKAQGFEFWYSSPELWCCQDYPILFDGVRLLTEDEELLIPPIANGNLTMALQDHLKKVGHCCIQFAPHNISKIINPLVFKGFNIEQVDNNYINSTERVMELRGNKLKKLRNNVHNFKTSLVSKPLTVKDIPKAVELCYKYQSQSTEFSDIEYNTKILKHMNHFDLMKIGYWQEEELVAFNVGAPLSSTTASFIISKSRHDIKYLVDYARYDFHRLAHEHGFSFVNDGSDLDSEGLAQLKRKFAPVAILPVYDMEWIG